MHLVSLVASSHAQEIECTAIRGVLDSSLQSSLQAVGNAGLQHDKRRPGSGPAAASSVQPAACPGLASMHADAAERLQRPVRARMGPVMRHGQQNCSSRNSSKPVCQSPGSSACRTGCARAAARSSVGCSICSCGWRRARKPRRSRRPCICREGGGRCGGRAR